MPAPFKADQGSTKRRSYRFSHRVPVVLTSADPSAEFYERCATTDVSSHGCQVRSPRKLTPGQKVRLQLPQSERPVEAQVARVRPDLTATAWEIGLELTEPGNIWGLEFSQHMVHWPADLPLPPIRPKPGAPPLAEPAPAVLKEEPGAAGVRLPRAGADTESPLGELSRLQEQKSKEFEARTNQTLRDVTNQLTKNAQFALNTVEASVRELSDSARQELGEWMAGQRAALDQQLRQALRQELEDFRLRLREALEASLQTLTTHLGKGKQS